MRVVKLLEALVARVTMRKRYMLIVLRVVGRGEVRRYGGNPQWRVSDGGRRQLKMGLCLIRREGV